MRPAPTDSSHAGSLRWTVAPVCGTAPSARVDGASSRDVGSIIVVVATDAPLTPDQLKRLARRVPLGCGMGRCDRDDGVRGYIHRISTANAGADEGNGADSNTPAPSKGVMVERLISEQMNPLFTAVTEATEEAVDNGH